MKLTKAQISWLLYDPAASSYALLVRTVAAPLLLSKIAGNLLSDAEVTSCWSMTASAAGIVSAAISVCTGPIADAKNLRKFFTGIFTFFGILSCFLYIPAIIGDHSSVQFVLTVSFIGIICFMAANNFYDSLLINIASTPKMDKLSSLGYGIGYAGSLTAFLLSLILLFAAGEKFFLLGAFLITILFWSSGIIQLLFNVHEKTARAARKKVSLKETFHFIFQNKNILIFLAAYFLYIDGVGTILLAATPLAAGLDIPPLNIMLTILGLQIIGLPCTIIYGKFAEKFSAKTMIRIAIAAYITISVTVTFMSFCPDLQVRQILFYISAAIIGTSQGGIQSLSRSLFSRIIPPNRASELFAVYNIFGKFTTIVGPIFIACTTTLWNKAELGITMLMIPFAAGAILLTKVKVPES